MSERPDWLRVKAPTPEQAEGMRHVRSVLGRYRLNTVCQGAICPNAVSCWGDRTATFMILGETCTRGCRFCGVPTGDPGGVLDETEGERLAAAVNELGLRYVVITSVDRDDLLFGGAPTYADAIRRVRGAVEGICVEALIPDFNGDPRALNMILASGPDVIAHNIETVGSLTPLLRDRRASYEQSLKVLRFLRGLADRELLQIKSGLMVGLGETRRELLETFDDLADAGVGGLTIGQYLKPAYGKASVKRMVPPEEFDELAQAAREAGIRHVIAGPLVRSSYRAAELFEGSRATRR